MATLFLIAVSIVIAGWLWFYIVRPILEDYGIIKVSSDFDADAPVMSSAPATIMQTDPVRDRFEPSEPAVVRAQQNRIELIEPPAIEPAHEPARLYRLSRQEEIIILAIQRDENGAYRHSANDITKFMGGTAADVKDQIRTIRDPKPAPEPPAQSVKRPAGGWAN